MIKIKVSSFSIRIAEKIKYFICTVVFVTMSLAVETKGAIILSSSLSMSGVYNDNLFFADSDKKPDFTSIVSPAFGLTFSSRNVVLSIAYKGLAQFQANNPEADGYFQNLSINLDLPILNRQIRGVKVTVTEDVNFSPELPGFSFGGDTDGIQQDSNALGQIKGPGGAQIGQGVQLNRVDTFQNTAGISLEYPWTKHIITTSSYTNTITRYSGDVFQDTETHLVTGNGDYNYPSSARTTWTGSYGVAIASGDLKNTVIHNVQLGVAHKMSRLTTGTGKVGIALPKDGSPNFILSVGVLRRFKKSNLSVRYDNQITPGSGIISSVTRRELLLGNATSQLGTKTAVSVHAGYTRTRSLSGAEVNADSMTAGSGISHRFLKWFSGSLNYNYLKQVSDGTLGADGERNTFSFTLSAVAPPWRILQ